MANYSKLKVIWKNNLNNIYKDNTIIGVGQEAVINMDENGISNIYVNFKVDDDFFTDSVEINGNVIQVPFRTDVLKVGTHQLEIVAHLKNGDIVPSPTFSYYVEKSLENADAIKADIHYPVLIELLEQVEEWNEGAVYQEEQRIANENERKSNEINRQSNENTRISNENERKSNESNRQQYETKRRVKEDERLVAEQSRVLAEEERQTNENGRIVNEEQRVIDEDDRIANENKRRENETERQNAEELRQVVYDSLNGRIDEVEDRLDVLDSQPVDISSIMSIIPVGYIDPNENNAIGVVGLPQDTYTLRYKNNTDILSNYYDIGTIESGKIFNRDMIKENIPPYDATKIGVYDSTNTQVGNIPLFYFVKEKGERLYSFGVLSDVHNQTNQGAESTADLQRALTMFNGREDVEFTCISGDITETATEAEYKIYQTNIQTCSPDTPVYATPGNHDCSQGGLDLTLWTQYTGCERTYEITYNNDHFLFLGMNKWSMGSSSCTPYLMEDLEWLSEKLDAYKNERCFIFTHLFFPEYAGNFKEIYLTQNWLMGTQHDYLKDLLNYYTNTIWFSGHSHWKWYLQKYEDNANIERAGGWTVHIPSCASPIDSDGVSTRVSKGLESEGAIIDVYEDYIDIRGIDLKNDMYIPTAKYRLDTTLVEVLDRKCKVTLNLQNATSSNTVAEVVRGESYETTITASSSGIMEITVTMNGVNITSTAVNGNTISIDKVTGDIVINVIVIQGYSTDLLQTCDINLNKRWSSSSNEYKDQDGTLAFSVPYSDIGDRTMKLIGFPKEHDGVSTWYAYNSSGTMIGRIADALTGVVWDSTALVDNGDGSYDIAISPEIFMSSRTTNPLTETPDTVYITMKTSLSSVSSTDGFRILVSDAKVVDPDEPIVDPDEPVVDPDEPIVDPDEPVEGFSTDLLETCDVKLNQRWSASSNVFADKNGAIAFSIPFEDIDGRTMKLIGFPEEHEGVSTWYPYNASGTRIGRIANASTGVVWDVTSLVNNNDGSYDIPISKEIFMSNATSNTTTPLTETPTTIYITMYVNGGTAISSTNGLKMLISD